MPNVDALRMAEDHIKSELRTLGDLPLSSMLKNKVARFELNEKHNVGIDLAFR
jgi:hypothetical protein